MALAPSHRGLDQFSATAFKITTGIYLIVIAMISSSIGGYLAGRLRTASLIGGTAAEVSQGAVTNAAQSSGLMEGYVDTLLRGDPAAQNANADSADARARLSVFLRAILATVPN